MLPDDQPAIGPSDELLAFVTELRLQIGVDNLYIFWVSGSGGGATASARQRTLVAFRTPDAALVFAQRNRLEHPRLRRLSLIRLLLAVVRESSINALLLASDPDDRLAPGQLPEGRRIERTEITRRMHTPD